MNEADKDKDSSMPMLMGAIMLTLAFVLGFGVATMVAVRHLNTVECRVIEAK